MDEHRLAGNLAAVRARIAAACARTGRDPGAVELIAVTKSVGPEAVAALRRLGVRDFGENRTPDLAAKREALDAVPGDPVRWHMIGHFQRNKVRRALPAVDVVHSVASDALARVLAAEAERAGRPPLPVYVQVNVAAEPTKDGFAPDDLGRALAALRDLPALRVLGLMTLAPLADDPETVRPVFRRLRELRDWARDRRYLDGSALSMGMTDDYEVAVEEGSTAVRVGRGLFAGAGTTAE